MEEAERVHEQLRDALSEKWAVLLEEEPCPETKDRHRVHVAVREDVTNEYAAVEMPDPRGCDASRGFGTNCDAPCWTA